MTQKFKEPKPIAERPDLFFPRELEANFFPALLDPSKSLTGLDIAE